MTHLYNCTPEVHMQLGTLRIKKYLEKLGNPQDTLNIIHVAGTNGKGSVVRLISTILSITALQKQRTIGSFTSPALLGPHDGIQINGKPIAVEQYDAIYSTIRDEAIHLTNFEREFITAIHIFKKHRCDVCVIETGMGGMDDATNVFNNILMLLITSIAFDHEQYLGPSIEDIVRHKLALAKTGKPIMVSRQQDILANPTIKGSFIENIIKYYCQQSHMAPLIFVDRAIAYGKHQYGIKTADGILKYNLSLCGDHQLQNSALAINSLLYLQKRYQDLAIFKELTPYHIQQGCLQTKWPGRMTWLHKHVLIDGAHNLQGMQALIRYVQQHTQETSAKKLSWIVAISQGKNFKAMLDVLIQNGLHVDQELCFTEFARPTNMPWVASIPAKVLQAYVPGSTCQSLHTILANLPKENQTNYIVCGSLYLVSTVYKYWHIDPWS